MNPSMQLYYLTVIPQPIRQTPDNFHRTLLNFVNDIKDQIDTQFTMNQLVFKYGFSKRRLYDVINVFEAAGCCSRACHETIKWLGLANALTKFKSQLDLIKINDDFEKLLPKESSTTFTQLTSLFLLIFAHVHSQVIEYKTAAHIISKFNGKESSILKKLYQIGQILEVGGFISKTGQPGQISLSNDLYSHIESRSSYCDINPLSLAFLVNPSNVGTPLPPIDLIYTKAIVV